MFFHGLWAYAAKYIVAAAGVLALFAGIRYRIRSKAKAEVETQMRERTLERVEAADAVKKSVDRLPDDEVIEKLRDNGWIR
jgi:hypothetical protein